MSHYPVHDAYVELNNDKIIDINDFWEETKAFKNEKEFEEWVENHPLGANLVQVERVIVVL